MSGSIRLHKEKGVNAHMTFCPRCGGESNGLVLMGAADHKGTCPDHGTVYGIFPGTRYCPAEEKQGVKCGKQLHDVKVVGDYERAPGPLCEGCENTLKIQKETIEAGGIAFRCLSCGAEGAIQLSENTAEFIQMIRAKGALGIEFEENCPNCHKKEEDQSNVQS